jgi:long-chain acyl-CoA synthetase
MAARTDTIVGRDGSAPQSTGAETLGAVVLAAEVRGDRTAIRYKRGDETVELSYGDVVQRARSIARGLLALGLEPQDRVSILSDTRPEWALADFGAFCAGAVVAPIYHTNSAQECAYVLAHADARVVFCENAAQAKKVDEVRQSCPALEHVVLLEGEAPGTMSLDELCAKGDTVQPEAVDERVRRVGPDDLATLVYTSGTTGPPKGCMLTHANFIGAMRSYAQRLDLADAVVYLFLPLAHVLARITQTVAIDVGGTIAFWSGDPKKVVDEVADFAPTHFPAVPRVFEKIHTKVLDQAESGGALQRAIFRWALAQGRQARAVEHRGERPRAWARGRLALADRLVLSKVRTAFGARLRLALVGAAPVAPEVLEFFDACGVTVLEGYGLTESCAAGTLNTEAELRYGTVGRPLPGTEVRIADDGEVLLRGPTIFDGYYKDADKTADALQDGWLHTGDLGELTGEGYLRITGRKKDLIITSSGKNISPSNIESDLRETRWISEAVVYGDRRPYLVALLVLDRDELRALAQRAGVEPDPAAMVDDPAVRAIVREDVDEVNRRYARIEQIKDFAILDRELTQDSGELTPTMKVKREVVYKRFADVFDAIYEHAA